MWKFEVTQKRFEIGKVGVGGHPGEYPTVLIGSIFYRRHKIVTDEWTGEFDRSMAEHAINVQDDFSDRTGNPCMVDVVASTPEAMIKYLDFAAKVSDSPLLIGGATPEARLAGLNYALKSGLADRVIYNSLTPSSSKDELEKIKAAGLKNAVLLAANLKNFTSEGRIRAVEELLPALSAAGVERLLVDTFVLDIPSLGQAFKAIYEVKNKFGLPAGCGAHNAVATWKGLKMKMGKQASKPALASASATVATGGADFILYGPIEDAPIVFPVVAMVNVALGQLLVEKGVRLPKVHPRYKVG
ncbi:MAG: tetrahydromethanopterin S-methyltransferase subunit H [Candidatus Bathyarchaeia archaeon]